MPIDDRTTLSMQEHGDRKNQGTENETEEHRSGHIERALRRVIHESGAARVGSRSIVGDLLAHPDRGELCRHEPGMISGNRAVDLVLARPVITGDQMWT